METKGKAVDSVIQYQLHIDGGGSGEFKCNYNAPLMVQFTTEEMVLTQELYDSDPFFIDSGLSEHIGETITKVNTNITLNDVFSNGLIFKDLIDYEYFYATFVRTKILSENILELASIFVTFGDNNQHWINISPVNINKCIDIPNFEVTYGGYLVSNNNSNFYAYAFSTK